MRYEPTWGGEFEGWVANFLKANYWRVSATMEREDAMQEARLLFYRLRGRYEVTEGAHFMALFKTSFIRRFHDLSTEDTRHHVRDERPADPRAVDPIGATDNDGYLRVMLRQAPREVAMVLSLFLNAPQELLDHALGGWKPGTDGRMANNGSGPVNRLLGLPDDYDSLGAVRDYLA